MLTLLNSLLLNFSLLIATLLFAFLPLRRIERISPNSSLQVRLAIGCIAGVIGALLIFNSISYDTLQRLICVSLHLLRRTFTEG